MKELISKLEEILEVENLDLTKKFTDYEEWDSLAGLSLIAMLDSDYQIEIKTKEILSYNSIEDFCKAILSK